MNCKSFGLVMATVVAVSLVASPGFSQCHSGKCNGRVSSGNGYGGPSGGYGTYGSDYSTPIQFGPTVAPVVNPVLGVTPPFGAKGTPAEPDFDFLAGGNLDVVVEHPLPQPAIKVQSPPSRGEAEPVEAESVEAESVEAEPVDTELEALEGIWAAVARSADGELRKIELKLDSGGWARLSIPDGAGKTTTIDRRAVVEEGQLKLKDGDQEMLLGELSQVESNQFVVTRTDGQVTFLKQ